MKYRVRIERTDEGYAVWCPGLPGCWSQGATEEESLENIRDAIETYLATVEELLKDKVTPRANPINAFTMGGIIKDAGMTVEEFKKQL